MNLIGINGVIKGGPKDGRNIESEGGKIQGTCTLTPRQQHSPTLRDTCHHTTPPHKFTIIYIKNKPSSYFIVYLNEIKI